MNQNSLSFLGLSCETELFEKFTQCYIEGVTFEPEVLEVLFSHYATEVIAEKKIRQRLVTQFAKA
jgi:hypothetical protein